MAKLLGTAYEVGNTESVVSRKPTSGTAIQEGLFVKQGAFGFVSLANTNSASAPWGIMAQQEAVACSVLLSGLRVAVQLDSAITPNAGEPVYCSAVTNKATNTSNSGTNFGTNATFTGVIGTDGYFNNDNSSTTNARWAEINLPNGL